MSIFKIYLNFCNRIVNYSLVFHIIMAYSKKPLVGIIMGSSSDSRIMQGAAEILDEYKIKHEDQIVSAHRTPARLAEYAKHAEKMAFKIIIAGAGGAAHLPGMIASVLISSPYTWTLPVSFDCSMGPQFFKGI